MADMRREVGRVLNLHEGELAHDFKAFSEVLPDGGRNNLYEDIITCQTHLRDLRENIRTKIIAPMKTRGKTPSVPSSPRPQAGEDVAAIASEMDLSYRTEQVKNDCLRGDACKCVLTGIYDSFSAFIMDTPDDALIEDTECGHIILFALSHFSERERDVHAATWDCLYRYFPEVRSHLDARTVNDPRNAMTLYHSMHRHFGKFRFSLEETDTADTCFLKYYADFPNGAWIYLPKDNIVRMTAHDARYPLPDTVLLRVHAAIAKFLHMSAMGEQIDKIMRDREALRCLSPDGSTDVAALLTI